jgi:hypothetical protein
MKINTKKKVGKLSVKSTKKAAPKTGKKMPVIKKKVPITSTTKKPAAAAKAAPPKEKKARAPKGEARPRVVTDPTSAQARLIEKLDKNFAGIKLMEEENQAFLSDLLESLGGATTFVHPKLGPMTVMTRGELMYWRVKPVGRRGNGDKKAAKPAEKASTKAA